MNRIETSKVAGIALFALKGVMAAAVGILVHSGEYGAAAFAACLFIDAAMPAQ